MAYGPNVGLQLRGLRELQRDLRRAGDREMSKSVTDALKEAGEPVADTAAGFAGAEIANIGPRWSQMKVGTRAGSVYVAPRSRRRSGGSPRPNLGVLLMARALIPAAEKHERDIERRVERALDRMFTRNRL